MSGHTQRSSAASNLGPNRRISGSPLLPSKPAAKVRGRALELATDEDRLAFAARELYWLPSGGTRESALDMKTIERLVGPTTMRTKGTIEQLAAKYFAG